MEQYISGSSREHLSDQLVSPVFLEAPPLDQCRHLLMSHHGPDIKVDLIGAMWWINGATCVEQGSEQSVGSMFLDQALEQSAGAMCLEQPSVQSLAQSLEHSVGAVVGAVVGAIHVEQRSV